MRIVKSTKVVKASVKVGDEVYIDPASDKLPRKCGTVESIDGDKVCIRDRNDSEITYCPKIDRVHILDIDACDDVKGCGDVKAAKQLSADEQALKHIKAAIDILGKSGNKDAVTKDSIANLGVVMFDLKSTK